MAVKIQVEQLTKIFGRNPRSILKRMEQGQSKEQILAETGHTVGLYDVNFSVHEGEVFVIMGLSGSGKSTLIRCLNLLHRPTDGKIWIDGENIVEYTKHQLRELRKHKIAMVFQHFGIITHRTVLDNVAYGLEIKGVSKAEREAAALRYIELVGLSGYEQQMPDELSGGMKQRIGLARALANDPDILLMDEPFSALDPLIRRDLQMELIEIQSKLQKTIIFITHDVNEAFKLGDRVAVMKDGQIVQIGTPEELLASPADDYIEEFVQDIDRTKVLQAKNAMMKPRPLITLKDGLRVAIQRMRSHGISSIFVVDQHRVLQGIVTIDDAVEAQRSDQPLQAILRHDYETTDPETYVNELIPQAARTKYPIAVVDEHNKLLGIIVRVSVLSALI
jgi:glycine betaine/proline transport system ATP-binding protein